MSSSPMVSVVMPAYNAQATVAAAIRSVLDQTFEDLELVVCDDASSDTTYQIASSFTDPRVRVLRNATNLGAGYSRDRAIQESRGSQVAVIDADDSWHRDRLRRLILAMEDDSNVAIFDDLLLCHHLDDERGMAPWRPIHGPHAFGAKGGKVVTVALEDYIESERLLIKPIFPKIAVSENQIKHSRRVFGEDAEFFIRLGLSGVKFRYLPEPLYFYRATPLSVTARSSTHHMREMLENAQAWIEMPGPIRTAIDHKISRLESDEYIHKAMEKAGKGQIVEAVAMLLCSPKHLLRSSNKAIKALRRRAHRVYATRMPRYTP